MKKLPKSEVRRFMISQSFIKDMRSYLAGTTCGQVIQFKYVSKDYPDSPTAAMKLGSYFEYILTGALTRDGKVPQPEYMVTPLKKNGYNTEGLTVADMYEGYRRAHVNAVKVKEYFKTMKIEILHVGQRVEKDGKYEGHLDVIALYNGELIIIDIKYSGLIEDKWSEHGWAWIKNPNDGLHQRKYHGTQAIHYKFLKDGIPYYFLVVDSSNDDGNVLFARIDVDDFATEQHIIEADELYKKFDFFSKTGFNLYPELKRCSECPLKDSCEYKSTFPKTEVVLISE